MKDFATKLPRVWSAAIDYSNAKGDVTEPAKALLDAALEDIPKLGWDAPFELLRLVTNAARAREEAGEVTIHFDAKGNGPFCKHGGIPFLCPTCSAVIDAEDAIRQECVRLARRAS